VDFYIGALLSINASPFRLTGADEKAAWLMVHPCDVGILYEGYITTWWDSPLAKVVSKSEWKKMPFGDRGP
jgi:hypothetical protein